MVMRYEILFNFLIKTFFLQLRPHKLGRPFHPILAGSPPPSLLQQLANQCPVIALAHMEQQRASRILLHFCQGKALGQCLLPQKLPVLLQPDFKTVRFGLEGGAVLDNFGIVFALKERLFGWFFVRKYEI
jgi:hypothetical protein